MCTKKSAIYYVAERNLQILIYSHPVSFSNSENKVTAYLLHSKEGSLLSSSEV